MNGEVYKKNQIEVHNQKNTGQTAQFLNKVPEKLQAIA